MKIKVRKFDSAKLDELETIVNQVLETPAYSGYGLVTAFLSPDHRRIVLVFQKP